MKQLGGERAGEKRGEGRQEAHPELEGAKQKLSLMNLNHAICYSFMK